MSSCCCPWRSTRMGLARMGGGGWRRFLGSICWRGEGDTFFSGDSFCFLFFFIFLVYGSTSRWGLFNESGTRLIQHGIFLVVLGCPLSWLARS